MDYKKQGYDVGLVCENGNREYSNVRELYFSYFMSESVGICRGIWGGRS